MQVERLSSLGDISEDVIRSTGEFGAILASDQAVPDPVLGLVRLSHAPGAASLPSKIPLQVAHDGKMLPIGKLTRLGIKDGQTVARVTLSRNHRDHYAPDLADGILTDISVSARILEHEMQDGVLVATRWEPTEGSFVSRGADPSAKLTRQDKPSMTTVTPQDHPTRVAEITALFAGLTGEQWVQRELDAVKSDDTLETIRANVIAELKRTASTPVATIERSPTAQPGVDQLDKFKEGFTQALELRVGLTPKDERRAVERSVREGPYGGVPLLEVAREYLRTINVDTTGKSRDQVANMALFTNRAGVIGHSSGDFPQLLAAVVNKSLAKGYDEAPETFQSWTGTDSAPDFKQASRPLMSAFSDLEEVRDDGEYKYGTFSDKQEVFTLQRFGKLFSIGRTALINDDTSSFSRIPMAMGRAAARLVGDKVYNVLTTGHSTYTMNEDAAALFVAGHSNYVASGSGAAISVATLNTARAAMATQTEQAGHTVRIQPSYLICSEASLATAETIVAAAHNPATASGVDPMPGYIGQLQVVSDPRIDADTATKWFLAASPSIHDTVLVSYLDGISVPMLEEQDAPITRDGVIYKVRHEFTVYAGDYRGLYLNWGA